jgi:integrase
MGLRRQHVDLADGFISVSASAVEVGGAITLARTKSAAGVRTVGIPPVIMPELSEHLRWAGGWAGWPGVRWAEGATPRRSNFARSWSAASRRARTKGTAVPDGLHFHDLRHTANGFASNVACLKELMARLGHSTTQAALIDQRAQRDRARQFPDVCPRREAA